MVFNFRRIELNWKSYVGLGRHVGLVDVKGNRRHRKSFVEQRKVWSQ